MNRAERRRQKREQEERQLPPGEHGRQPPQLKVGRDYFVSNIDPGTLAAKFCDGEFVETNVALAGGRELERAVDLAGAAHRRFDEVSAVTLGFLENQRAAGTVPKGLDCGAGCAFCCYVHVVTTVPEVLSIAERIEKEARKEFVLAAIDKHLSQLPRDVARDDARAACPLLDERNRCSVYSDRPLACRGWSSFDVSLCETNARDPASARAIPAFGGWKEPVDGQIAGITAAIGSVGMGDAQVHLVEGLRIALQLGAGEANRRWRNGSRPFRDAAAAY